MQKWSLPYRRIPECGTAGPIWEAQLKAEARVARSLGYIECEITNEQGLLIAKAASTCLALRGEQAKGR